MGIYCSCLLRVKPQLSVSIAGLISMCKESERRGKAWSNFARKLIVKECVTKRTYGVSFEDAEHLPGGEKRRTGLELAPSLWTGASTDT